MNAKNILVVLAQSAGRFSRVGRCPDGLRYFSANLLRYFPSTGYAVDAT